MKLGKRNKVLVSFMLFSLFFGAGKSDLSALPGAKCGQRDAARPCWVFCSQPVVLPVLGVIVVARFDGWIAWLSR